MSDLTSATPAPIRTIHASSTQQLRLIPQRTVLRLLQRRRGFDLNFVPSLWSELKPHGLDVFSRAIGMTDTLALSTSLREKGLPLPPGVASAEEVAAFCFGSLAIGPVQNWGVPETAPVGSATETSGAYADGRGEEHQCP